MIRVIYLLSLRNLDERVRLIESTLAGNKWRIQTSNGKYREVTDKDMVVLAQQLQYWTQSVYKFGCGFIHLSNYHNYSCENPFDRLASSEQQDILRHMRYYHGGPETDKPSLIELANYIPAIFEKISSNLECYLKELENNEFIEIK